MHTHGPGLPSSSPGQLLESTCGYILASAEAEDEWARIEAERLGGLIPVLPYQLNSLCLFQLLFGYDQVWAGPSEYGSGGLKTRVIGFRQNDHLVTRFERVIKASSGGSK